MKAPKRPLYAFAGLRIAVGVLFLIFAQYKVLWTQFTLGGGFEWWIHQFLDGGQAYPFMVPILKGFVLSHPHQIAFFVAYSELVIGLSLVFGVVVRAASIGGIIYMLTLLFASNYPGRHAPAWEFFGAALDHLVFALCFAAFAFGEPDRVLSIKNWKRHR